MNFDIKFDFKRRERLGLIEAIWGQDKSIDQLKRLVLDFLLHQLHQLKISVLDFLLLLLHQLKRYVLDFLLHDDFLIVVNYELINHLMNQSQFYGPTYEQHFL